MLYVVIQLLEPRKRIIIPESFIFNLCEQSLKNVGKNSNHRYLIYYSKSALGDETSAPDVNWAPNFQLPLCKVFPPFSEYKKYKLGIVSIKEISITVFFFKIRII